MSDAIHPGSIVILDCGGQYAHLIANRVRRLGAFSEIRIAETPAKYLKNAAGIILSGGPQSVYEKGSPQADPEILQLGIPILGLCYGHQWVAHALKGKVESGHVKEYGKAELQITLRQDSGQANQKSQIFSGVPEFSTVWMSHGDEVTELPDGFEQIGKTSTCHNAAFANAKRNIFGCQFHMEVTHTEYGMQMLKNFVGLCDPAPWKIDNFTEHVSAQIKKEVGDKNVFMLVSGGVDSTVAFTLLNKVLGVDRVQGLLVDTGLMRKNEIEDIRKAMEKLGIKNLHIEDKSEKFFEVLKGVYEPEEKRKRIGNAFILVQAEVGSLLGKNIEDGWLLGQGTIYPDTIESKGTKHADHIKTHHNRVELIQHMIDQGWVIEPLKDLYKDEVRRLGEDLGLPHDLVWRHPFPGPGLGVRILCAASPSPLSALDTKEEKRMSELLKEPHIVLPVKSVGVQGDGRTYRHAVAVFSHHPCKITPENIALGTSIPNQVRAFNRVLLCTSHSAPFEPVFSPGFLTRERADLLREADSIVTEEIKAADLYEAIWQFPVVLLPCGSDKGNQSIVLRPISSQDAMTADAFVLPENVLEQITRRLLDLPGIGAVFFDLTHKPPATIEWE